MVTNYWELDVLNHEIRTPLAGLLGMVRRFTRGPLTSTFTQKDYLQDIDTASSELLNAVEGFLKQAQVIISETSERKI